MPRRRTSDVYRAHVQRVGRHLVHFRCVRCPASVLARDYRLHCERDHGTDTRNTCVWCLGKLPAHRYLRVAHVANCFRTFAANLTGRPSAPPENPTVGGEGGGGPRPQPQPTTTTTTATPTTLRVLDLSARTCPERDFFGHDADYIRNRLPPEALETFNPLPVDNPRPLRYTDDSLNLAADYLVRFVETTRAGTHDWHEVLIAAVAFPSFLRALRAEQGGGTTRLLEFSCWCDAGDEPLPRHRQHRHAIVASEPRGHFESRVWGRIGTSEVPRSGYRWKRMRGLREPMDLLHALGNICQRTALCDGVLWQNVHFHVLRDLPVLHPLPLCVLFEDGLTLLLCEHYLRNVDPERLMASPLTMTDGGWVQRLGDLRGLPTGVALPVDRSLAPLPEASGVVTPYFVHLVTGRRLHFERLADPPPSEEEWLRLQAAGGNAFFDVVADATWMPRPRDQEKLALAMPRQAEIERLRAELGRRGQEARAEIERLRRENERLRREEVTRLERLTEECRRRVAVLKGGGGRATGTTTTTNGRGPVRPDGTRVKRRTGTGGRPESL